MDTSLKSLSEIIAEIDTLFACDAFGIVNMMLIKATKKLKDMPSDKLVTYARVSFVARDKLPAWATFIDGVDAELTARNLDSKRILRGLI